MKNADLNRTYKIEDKTRQLGVSIKANVMLGVLAKHCKGQGICKIIPYEEKQTTNCRVLPATIELQNESNLLFRFEYTKLCENCRQDFWDMDSFVLEDDFLLPRFVCEALGLYQRILKRGSYPLLGINKCHVVVSVASYW